MNQKLIEHGILQDESNYRVHVGFRVGAIYVFPTESGKEAVRTGKYREVDAWQKGINYPTGKGIIPPWHEIKGCREVEIPDEVLKVADCKRDDNTSVKGQKAVAVVRSMQIMNKLPIPITITEVRNEDMQIAGVDLATRLVTIQVKCDFDCGDKGKKGTGNLFLQTHECNPLGRI